MTGRESVYQGFDFLAKTENTKTELAASGTVAASKGAELQTEELSLSFGYLLRRLQLAYKKNFLRIANDDIQNGLVGTLLLVGLNPGIKPSQISALLGVEATQVALMLGKLELQRLVRRPTSRSDGRSRPVRLTAAGERFFARVREVSVEAESSFIGDALNEDETRQLRELLQRLLAYHSA